MAVAATALGLGLPQAPVRVVVWPAHAGIGALVSGLPGSGTIWIRLEGATDANAHAHPWSRLHSTPTGWRGVVPRPVLVGVYPIVLRRGVHRYARAAWILRVFPSAAVAVRRTFATPTAAARDWVAHLPGRQVLVAQRPWKKTALDRRDRRLNRMLVIAYAPRGSRRADDRRGIFLTLARDRVGGRWRLLQASVAPYG